MSCPIYTAFGANAESTRLTTLENRVKATFLLENPTPPTPCPLKLAPQSNRIITTQLESRRLLNKVVKCPLYIRKSTSVSCITDISNNIKTQQYSNITGIQQVTQPVIGVSSGTLIAQKRIDLTSSGSSPFTPVFFRTFGPNTTSSGGPLYVCPPVKTAQDPGVPVARNVVCIPGGRVVG